MRCLIRCAMSLALTLSLWLAVGCSDDGTGPDDKPAPTLGKHIWSMRFGNEYGQHTRALAVDASGNVFIAGVFYGTVDFGGGPLTASGSREDIYVAKFGPDGSHIWSKRFGDEEQQSVQSIAVDPSGNAIITGNFKGSINFGGTILTSSSVYEDVFVAKFGPGGAEIWAKRFGDPNPQEGTAVAADAWGNIVVTGIFQGSIYFGGDSFVSNGGWDVFVARFKPNGAHIWSKSYGNPYEQYSNDVAVDASGNVFVVGPFLGALDFGCGVLATTGGTDLFIAKLDSAGVCRWSDSFGSGPEDQYVAEIAVDASGNAIITGFFEGTVDFGGGTLTSAGDRDIYVAKFGSGGNHLWSRRFGDAATQSGYAIAADASGNAIITGSLAGSTDFGGGTLTETGYGDVFIAKFGSGGNHLWSKRFGDAQYQAAFALGADASGNVFAAGAFEGTIAFGGDTLTSAGGNDIFVVKLGP